MKARFIGIWEVLREDWSLVLVALGIALMFWWNVTQRQMTTRFLPGVEVNLETNLKASLRLADRQELKPKVSVRVTGPIRLLNNMTSSDFQINADLSGITEATRTEVFLSPGDFVLRPYLIAGGLPAEQFRVASSGGISPSAIPVETVWNETVVNIVPKISGNPARGYILASTKVTPSTLTVAGSPADIAKLRSVHNKNEIVLRGESSMPVQYWTLSDLELGNLTPLDWGANQPIRLEMSIEPQYLKKTFKQVQVQILDATPESPSFAFKPKSVDLSVQGFRPSVLEVTNTSIALGVSLAGLKSGTNFLNASLLRPIGLPNQVEIIQVTPSTIAVRLWSTDRSSNPAIQGVVSPDLPLQVSPTPLPEIQVESATATIEAATVPISATAPSSATIENSSP